MDEASVAHPAPPSTYYPEIHHTTIPQCLLLGCEIKAEAAALDGGGIEAWLEYEHEAMRYGVDPEISRDDLATFIDSSSTVILERAQHTAWSTLATSLGGVGGEGLPPSSSMARGASSCLP